MGWGFGVTYSSWRRSNGHRGIWDAPSAFGICAESLVSFGSKTQYFYCHRFCVHRQICWSAAPSWLGILRARLGLVSLFEFLGEKYLSCLSGLLLCFGEGSRKGHAGCPPPRGAGPRIFGGWKSWLGNFRISIANITIWDNQWYLYSLSWTRVWTVKNCGVLGSIAPPGLLTPENSLGWTFFRVFLFNFLFSKYAKSNQPRKKKCETRTSDSLTTS